MNTRLAKLDAGDYDAVILAAAGLRRLGLGERIRGTLADAIPAIGQGILAVEFVRGRDWVARAVAPFEDPDTAAAARAERALGLVVEGSCEVPVGGYAQVRNGVLALEGFVGLPDGSRLVRDRVEGAPASAEALGTALGGKLLEAGGREILAEISRPAKGRVA